MRDAFRGATKGIAHRVRSYKNGGAARDTLEAGARGLAFTLARCAAVALLARQATWSKQHGDARPAAALQRFVRLGLDRLVTPDPDNTALLLR